VSAARALAALQRQFNQNTVTCQALIAPAGRTAAGRAAFDKATRAAIAAHAGLRANRDKGEHADITGLTRTINAYTAAVTAVRAVVGDG
jgi:hypothetical protein